MVERRSHLGGEARIAVAVPGHQRTDSGAAGLLAQRGQQRPSFEARTGRVGNEDWIKVVVDPERIVAPFVGFPPKVGNLLPRDHLLAALKSKANRMWGHGRLSLNLFLNWTNRRSAPEVPA